MLKYGQPKESCSKETGKRINDSFYKLYHWIEGQNFTGNDPYDALNTEISFLKKKKYCRLIITYINKYSPINFRNILNITASKSNKAMALICSGLIRLEPNKKTSLSLKKHINYLLSKSLISKYGYHCWNSHEFPIHMTSGYSTASTPDIIGTESCASTILNYYQYIRRDNCLRKVILSVREFFLKVLLSEKNSAIFFKYRPTTSEHDCVYNASLNAAKYIARVNAFFNNEKGNDIIKECYRYVISQQNSDGSWYYGVDLRNNYQKKQIDFHQGFILDAILDYLNFQSNYKDFFEAYMKGLKFYYYNQFSRKGMSFYRYPRKCPIDIHNQAQGIITFSNAGRFDVKYLNFAKTIADWTIINMQSDSGYFYYQKYPFMTNKIPYMRWGQAWMLYALSHLLSNRNSNIN